MFFWKYFSESDGDIISAFVCRNYFEIGFGQHCNIIKTLSYQSFDMVIISKQTHTFQGKNPQTFATTWCQRGLFWDTATITAHEAEPQIYTGAL